MINSNLVINYPLDPDARKTIVAFQVGQADPVTGQFTSPGTVTKISVADADNGKVPPITLQGVSVQRVRLDILDASGVVKGTKQFDHDYGYPLPDISVKSSGFTYNITVSTQQ